jgi:uncharacterized membrane protein HdeD (DUF308 family)
MPTLRVVGRTDVFDGGAWQAAFVIGCATVALGALTMVWPDKRASTAEVLFGLALFLVAAWELVVAFKARISRGMRVLQFPTAICVVLLGLSCIRSGDWVTLLAVWVGMAMIAHGIVQALVAVWSDDLPNSGRQEVFGLLTLMAGVAVIVWPLETLSALSALVGLCMILIGAGEIRGASRIDRPEPTGGEVGVQGLLRSQPGQRA